MVQPHYVDKANFEGEWYLQQTVVDVSPEVSLGFTGYEANLEKISWEITENTLFAYRTYEPILGLDDDDTLEGSTYQGDPVAAFNIIRHFDIQRSYNPSTAEPSNVVIENVFDRPWRQRQFMRIDWSSNRISGPSDMTLVWYFSQTADYVRETERFDPDHLIIDEDYIQFTMTATLSDRGRTCFYSYGVYGCGSADARVRFSFSKIDPEEEIGFKPMSYPDTEPLARLKGTTDPCPHPEHSVEFATECEHLRATSFQLGKDNQIVEYACTPDFLEKFNTNFFGIEGYYEREDCGEERVAIFERFGYFRTERFMYDRQLGGSHDSGRKFYANHHKIWRDVEQTHPEPIIYYTNPGYPKDLEEVTSELGNEWDQAFLKAVQLKTDLSEQEIRDLLVSDATAAGVESWMFLKGDRLRAGAMYQVRRNSCSPEGVADYVLSFERDQPKHTLLEALIDEATEGEGLLPGNLLKVCAALRHATRAQSYSPSFHWQQLGDLRYSFVNWVHNPQPSGPLGYGPSAADPETGRILKGNANVYGAAIDTYARSAADVVRAMNEDLSLDHLLSGQSYADWLESDPTSNLTTSASALTVDDIKIDEPMHGFDPEQLYGSFHTHKGHINPKAFERHTKRRLSSMDPLDPLTPASIAPNEGQSRLEALRADPRIAARAQDPELVDLLRPLYDLGPYDEVTKELIDHAEALTLSPKESNAYRMERVKFFADQNMLMADFIDDSVIGLALQLKGRSPEEVYQTLRKEIYRAVMLHEIGHTLGLTHNFSASFDALNYPDRFWELYEKSDDPAARARSRMPEYRYTSIMDYGSRFNADIHGLGRYDHAAISFVYSGEKQVEVFTGNVPFAIESEVFINGYEAIPEILGGDLSALTERTHRPLHELTEERVKGLLTNSHKITEDTNEALAAAGYESDFEGDPPPWEGYYYADREVPYKYCFDFYNGNLECRTWDEGASHQDVISGAIQSYWNYFAFNQYRRGRNQSAFINGYLGRQSRLGFYLSYPFRYYYFYQSYDLNLRLDLFRAAVTSLNFISQVLGTPESGRHCLDPDRNLYVSEHQLPPMARCLDPIDVPVGVGRDLLMRRNDEYQAQVDYIGTYYDKLNFLFYLTDTSSFFFRIANLGDNRSFSIGYYRVYQEEIIRLIRDMLFSWLDAPMSSMSSTPPEDDVRLPDGESFHYFLREGNLEPRVLTQAAAYGQDGDLSELPRIQAPIRYNILWQALVLNSVFNTSTYDGEEDFAEYIAISEESSGDDRSFDPMWDVARFVHPHTGVAYRAAQTLDGDSIAYEVIQRAQTWVDERWTPAKAVLESDPEDPQAQRIYHEAEAQLGRYNDIISDLRLLRSALDFYND